MNLEPEKSEPAWMSAAVDQRLALMAEGIPAPAAGGLDGYTVITTPLTEPPEGERATKQDSERWDHSCDNCGVLVRAGMVTGYVERELHGRKVMIFFGSCPDCMKK